MKYCFRCGHLFSHKSNLNRHLSRKLPCEPKYLDISGIEILENFLYYEQEYNKINSNLNIIINSNSENINNHNNINGNNGNNIIDINKLLKIDKPKKLIINNESDDSESEYCEYLDDGGLIYKCEGCRKKFNRKNNYYRHRKFNCPVLKDDYVALKLHKKKLDTTYRQMKQEHLKLEDDNENITTTIINDIKDTSNQSQHIQTNKLENSLNSYNTNAHNFQLKQNTHDIFNKNEFNITINEYGKEDVSSFTQSEWKQIVKRLYHALPDLVKKVHFDIETNRNVYVPNIREKYAMVWKDGNWEMMDIRDVLDDLLVNNTDRLYEFLEENEGMLSNSLHNKMNDIIEKIGNSKKLQKKYQDQIKTILINNRSVVKKTYENEYGKKLEIK
jgi:hypothetical protein